MSVVRPISDNNQGQGHCVDQAVDDSSSGMSHQISGKIDRKDGLGNAGLLRTILRGFGDAQCDN